MAKRTYRLDDPFFNEFVFQTIFTAPQDVKNKLPTGLLKYTTSVEKIKGFAEKAKLERKLEMLARLGGAFSLSIHPPGWMTKEKLHEVIDNYLNEERTKDIDEMIAKNIFVVTNRELVAIHNLMAMNCHNGTYMLNRDYPLIATQIASASHKLNPKISDLEILKQVMEDHKLLCKFMLYNVLHQDFVDGTSGFKARELLMLLLLFINRHRYVDIAELIGFFQHTYTPSILNVVLHKLEASYYIERFPNRWRYTIAGPGIQTIGGYVNRVLNQTLHF